MLAHIKQEHSDGCGAACLAMITGTSYASARALLPGYTSEAAMQTALLGMPIIQNCRLMLLGNDKHQHWVVLANGFVFDPAYAEPTRKLNKRYSNAGIIAGWALEAYDTH